jgi:DNA adenine methylase
MGLMPQASLKDQGTNPTRFLLETGQIRETVLLSRQSDRRESSPMAMVRSPLRWVGGKSKLRKRIIDRLPPNGMYSCYVEVFGGAGWVLFAKEPSPVEVLNDIDGELINFFRVLRKEPNELVLSLLNYPLVSREEFETFVLQKPPRQAKVARAHRFYYLLMAGWGGEIGYPRFQTSITDHGKGNRLFGGLRTLRQRLYPAYERLSRVTIEHLDWRECFDRYDDGRTFMYLDPPYPGNNCNYFFNMDDPSEHIALLKRLSVAKCKWLITSYDTKEIRSHFGDYHISPVRFGSGMDGKDGRTNKEIIVTNYDINELSKAYHKIVAATGTERISLEDKVRIKEGGNHGKEGRIVGFHGSELVIQSSFKRPLRVPADQVEVKSRANGIDDISQRLRSLRKEVVASLKPETMAILSGLEQQGYISDAPAVVADLVHKAAQALKREPAPRTRSPKKKQRE